MEVWLFAILRWVLAYLLMGFATLIYLHIKRPGPWYWGAYRLTRGERFYYCVLVWWDALWVHFVGCTTRPRA